MKYVELNLFLEEEDEVQRISAPNDSKEQVSSKGDKTKRIKGEGGRNRGKC